MGEMPSARPAGPPARLLAAGSDVPPADDRPAPGQDWLKRVAVIDHAPPTGRRFSTGGAASAWVEVSDWVAPPGELLPKVGLAWPPRWRVGPLPQGLVAATRPLGRRPVRR